MFVTKNGNLCNYDILQDF